MTASLEIIQDPPSPLTKDCLIDDEAVGCRAEVVLTGGNKALYVHLTDIPEVSTYVMNIEGDLPKTPGLTTSLYKRARLIMEEVAALYGESLTYTLITENPAMRAWALDPEKGSRIFRWEKVAFEGEKIEASATINPSKSSRSRR
ncbi:hypothetical protein A3B45_02485 [Candidatus Daviesbacteria bacterium RIFCSPLOWO2_01_FULL_39_12]|uniref:Uncharacterized protein n=1 Tax=Candidatus Daviesbacteria bacterium RIFCSPLOWO2_01_FULL_39_12 TaxID=1797785 RepID=A0A1F5KSS0_9BACT|nr:MAG: hypothetical protein A3B45_02485 [Candidatus Daviesbacteria bacterium RIFCSPLOWO2_01_FULL_39_12]